MDKFSLKDLVKEEIETPAPKTTLWEPLTVEEKKEPVQEFSAKTSRIGSLSSLNEDLKETKTEVKSGWTPLVQKVEEPPKQVFTSKKPPAGFKGLKESIKVEISPTLKTSIYERIELPPVVEYKKTAEEERDELVQSFTEQIKDKEQSRSIEPTRSEPIEEPVAEEATTIEPIIEEEPKEKTLIDKASEFITKELKTEENSFQQPDVPPTAQNFKEVTRKMKFLEEWIAKVSMAGPGGGAVNLKDLDDVDYASVKNATNDQVLAFNASSNLWIAKSATAGGGVSLTDLSVTLDTPAGNGTLAYDNNTGIFNFVPANLAVKANVADLTTANVIELGNLYFTNARVVSALSSGENISIDANGRINATATSGTEVDTLATVTNRGNVTTNGITVNNANVNFLSVNTTAGFSVTTGQIAWNAADLTFDMGMENGVVLQVGQEQYIKVKAANAITNGKVVMFAGVNGEHILGTHCVSTSAGFRPDYVIGVATQDIAKNGFGYITTFGKVHDVNTLAFSEGDILYVDPLVAGGLTNTEPTAPYYNITVAAVTKRAGGDGHLMVRVSAKPDLHELNDVRVTSPTAGQSLVYQDNIWYNRNITSANVTELTNLYFTNARVVSAVSTNTLGNISTGNIVVSGTYDGISITGDRGNMLIGNNTRNGVVRYALNSAQSIYSGMQIQRNGSEAWFSGVNTTENFVIRANSATDILTINSNGTITVTGSINGYAANTQLAVYATNAQLATYATNAQLATYATNAQLASYATNAQLTSYATTTNVALKANIVDLTTANVTEVTNLYFTNARATAAVTRASLSNLTVGGNVVITYQPATTVGAGIVVNAANTQGGTGYADFLKVTNISNGTTNPNKSFRLTSDGQLQVINSAYAVNILNLSDAGSFSVPGPISISGKQAVNGPAFRAYVATGQTITSGSQQKVTFGSESFDTDSCFASSKFTPTVEGYYQLNTTVRIDGTASTGECMLVLYKNGSEYARGNNESGTEQGSSFYSMQVSDIAYANGTTDNFEVYIQQTSGGNRSTTAGSPISYFSGCMIRGA